MEDMNLLSFAAHFGTVGAWRTAMLERGYTMPLQLCQGLSEAMRYLNLTFPDAFRLLWNHRKILVSGRSLIYARSAPKLWTAGPRPDGAGPPSRDVLAEVPPTKEIVYLENIWRLDAGSSPLQLLWLWEPTDKTDQYLRRFLLDFGHRVLAAGRTQPR